MAEQLDYIIGLLSPVLLTNSVGDPNISLSHDYLPGSSLLGMFAGLYIQKHLPDEKKKTLAHTDEDFATLFLSGKLRFLNGYPLSRDKQRTLPIPRSILTPKRRSSDYFETLFEEQKADDPKKTEVEKKAGQDDRPNTPKAGFCLMKYNSGRLDFERPEIKKTYHFHHRRTDQLAGRNVDGTIFNYEALEKDQAFGASLIGDAETVKLFQAKFGSDKRGARLGRSKNTEYGQVEIEWKTAAVNECLSQKEIEGDSFVITLLSDAILLNEYGQSEVSVKVFAENLTRLLAKFEITLAKNQLQVEKHFLQSTVTENYVGIWKARKPSMSAFTMGSCFRFSLNPALKAAQETKLVEALSHLQNEGIGIRRNEGLGRVAVNWQMNAPILPLAPKTLQMQKEAAEKNVENKTPPSAFQTIFKNLLWQAYGERARAIAAKHLKDENYRLARGEFIAGAQMSRLQRFAATSATEKAFQEKIKELAKRETARNYLSAARNQQQTQTLLDFLLTGQIIVDQGWKSWHFLDEILQPGAAFEKSTEKKNEQLLCGKINYDPANDQNLRHELFRTYMTTFFALMSKKAREEAKKK